MSYDNIDALAGRYGIASHYDGPDGERVQTAQSTKAHLLNVLGVDATATNNVLAEQTAPELTFSGSRPCYIPDWLRQRPAWGITLQLYELRSRRDWGIGDFAALAEFCDIAGRAGADFVGLTPLHALFSAQPGRCSPFSPSNRRFLNPLYIAVDRVAGFKAEMVDAKEIEGLRRLSLVDYEAVSALKLAVLKAVWGRWRCGDVFRGLMAVFDDHLSGNDTLYNHALFEAVSAHMSANGRGVGWTHWPAEFQRPDSPAVTEFAEDHSDEVSFHAWLQWLAASQLERAARASREAGMRIGLYVDLAVGEAPDGSAVWSDHSLFVTDTHIGAPPDFFTARGQDWGVSALSPLALRRGAFLPFTRLIEDATNQAGALRIDHVMALWQLFLIPSGSSPDQGAHLRYPTDDLLQELATISNDRQIIMIGEDLGHVPDGFREIMQQAGILSYRILYFEVLEDGAFRPPSQYPELSIACLSTHDLPTLRGWWLGIDIELRRDHGLIDPDSAESQFETRRRERQELLDALQWAGEPLDEAWNRMIADPGSDMPQSLAVAVHGFIGDSRALLAGVRLADLVGETVPTNLPGTSDGFPNWRLRCATDLEELGEQSLFGAITSAMADRRPRQ